MTTLNCLARELRAMRVQVAALAPDPDSAAEARQRQYLGLWQELLATMAEEHIWRLRAAWQREPGALPCRLAEVAAHLVGLALDEQAHFSLALPPPVAEAYLTRGGWPFMRCAGCALGIPYEMESRRGGVPVPAWTAFDRCPECGGEVCWYNYGRASGTPGAGAG